MLLNSVILVLQETLEVALLVSVLLVISYQWRHSSRWLLFGICSGLFLSLLYAGNMAEISEWFDYVGQEIVNAALQIITSLLIVLATWAFSNRNWNADQLLQPRDRGFASIFIFCAAAAVALAITRECSELLLYMTGFFQQEDYFQTIMAGGSIGFSIGLSIGILLYYALSSLRGKWHLDIPVVLLALFAGNMLSQAVLQLTQADWISSEGSVWDSSVWLPENSILGQLLYALVGYEATPSAAQVLAYILGVVLVLVFCALGKYASTSHTVIGQNPVKAGDA